MNTQKLYDLLNESEIFVTGNKKLIMMENLDGIRQATKLGAVMYVVLLLGKFVQIQKFSFIPFYFLPVPVFIVAVLLQRHFWRTDRTSTAKIRTFAGIFYVSSILMFSVIESLWRADERAVFFPIALVLLPAFYMDYFSLLLIFNGVMYLLQLLIWFFTLTPHLFKINAITALFAYFAMAYSYAIILKKNAEHGESSKSLLEKSEMDLLTGLLNKKSFEEKCKAYLSSGSETEPRDATLFILDFDNFKSVNDLYGHKIGDLVLEQFGMILKSNFRHTDIVGRVGGDEFMVLLVGSVPDGYIEKRCDIVQHELNITHIDRAAGFSCSIGVAENHTVGATFEQLYQIADSALYEAKEAGKARFVKKTA